MTTDMEQMSSGQLLKQAAADAEKYASADLMLSDKMPALVKGVGFAKPGGNRPLDDDIEIFKRSMNAETLWRKSIKAGIENPQGVIKGLNPGFMNQHGRFLAAGPQNQAIAQLTQQIAGTLSAELGKNITLTSPLSSGLVPFDLVAPSRLIYPVFSPIRNKLPRVPGQGTSRRTKVITGISGSQTGASGGKAIDLGISELVGGTIPNNWPLNLPGAGTQDSVDLNIPYRFSGLSESLSWLAQFAGRFALAA